MKKRMLNVLLGLCLSLYLLPAVVPAVRAEEDFIASVTISGSTTYHKTFSEAVAAAEKGTKDTQALLEILADCDVSVMPDEPDDTKDHPGQIETGVMTIDLKGYTLTNSALNAHESLATVLYIGDSTEVASPVVTIIDSSEKKTGMINAGKSSVDSTGSEAVSIVRGEVTLKGGTYVGSHPITVRGTEASVTFCGDAVVDSKDPNDRQILDDVDIGIQLLGGGSATVTGGTIYSQRPFDVVGNLTVEGAPILLNDYREPLDSPYLYYRSGKVDLSGCINCHDWIIENIPNESGYCLKRGGDLLLPNENYIFYDYNHYWETGSYTTLQDTAGVPQLKPDERGQISDHVHEEADSDGDHLCDIKNCGRTITKHSPGDDGFCTECNEPAPWLIIYGNDTADYEYSPDEIYKYDLDEILDMDRDREREESGPDITSIQLRKDLALEDDAAYFVESILKLDLNGYTLNMNNSTLSVFLGNLTITDSPTPAPNSLEVYLFTPFDVLDLRQCTSCIGWKIHNFAEDWDGTSIPMSAEAILLPGGSYLTGDINNGQIAAKGTVSIEAVTVKDNTVNVPETFPENTLIYAAAYTKDGKMLGIQLVAPENNILTVSGDSLKLFFLEEDSYSPRLPSLEIG